MRRPHAARLGTALATGLLITTLGAAGPAEANRIGPDDGCTPGYWKNHTDNWEEATPDQSLLPFNFHTSLGGMTFLQALGGGGGPGVAGAERILIRAAVAAYLNAAHEGLGFPWRRWQEGLDGRPPLVPTVNQAFASGDRATMIALAERLDADNNLGCPL
jgi:hypothetical protein